MVKLIICLNFFWVYLIISVTNLLMHNLNQDKQGLGRGGGLEQQEEEWGQV